MTEPAPRHLRLATKGGAFVPPTDLDAEAAVLSAVLLDPAAMPKVRDFLRPEHFYSEAHRRMFEAASWLFAAKEPIDPTTLASRLRATGRLEQVGGAGYIAEVLAASPVVANVRSHALAVHDVWRRRELVSLCERLDIQSRGPIADVQAWIAEATRAMGAIAHENPLRRVETNEEALVRILADSEAAATRALATPGVVVMSGYPLGLPQLDARLGGLRRKAKTTVAATSGVGKTAFAVQACVALAKQGIGVAMFSTEMSREEVLRRALACEAQIPAPRIRDGRLSPLERQRLVVAAGTLKALPWRIDETARLTIEALSAAARLLAEEMPVLLGVPLAVVVVDYIQRLEPSPHVARREKHEQIGHATKSLKILSQEIGVAVLELAQAKGAFLRGKRRRPSHDTDIADCSQIAKESDDVLFLVPDLKPPPGDPRVPMQAFVTKNRAGPPAEIPMLYRGDMYRFSEPASPDPMLPLSRQYVDPEPEPPSSEHAFSDLLEGR